MVVYLNVTIYFTILKLHLKVRKKVSDFMLWGSKKVHIQWMLIPKHFFKNQFMVPVLWVYLVVLLKIHLKIILIFFSFFIKCCALTELRINFIKSKSKIIVQRLCLHVELISPLPLFSFSWLKGSTTLKTDTHPWGQSF